MLPGLPRMARPLAAIASVLVLCAVCSGCPASRTCAVPGTSGCECTAAGTCDPGLTCTSGVCLRPGEPPPSGTPTNPTEPPVNEAAITPLPPKTFVFKKRFKREGDKPDEPVHAFHLYAYDLATRSERLISTLDDPGKGGWYVAGGKPSPDRRWIAFGKQDFRVSPEDRKHISTKGGIVWSVSADGKAFKRLTAPFAEEHVFSSYDVRYNDPVWSSDGTTVYFEDWRFNNCVPGYGVHGCMKASLRAATNLAVTTEWVFGTSCIGEIPVDIHPSGQTVLVRRLNCQRAADGLVEMTLNGKAVPTDKRYIAKRSTEYYSTVLGKIVTFNFDPQEAAWLPDGSGVLIVGSGPTKKAAPDPSGQKFRWGVHRWTEGADVKLLYEPETDDRDITDIAVSKAGDVIVVVTSRVPGNETSQLYLFDLQTGKLGEQLTNAGDNVTPAW
jgi:hypothetical protein